MRWLGTFIGGSFNTIIGLIFLAIVSSRPDGLMGLWERLCERARARGGTGRPAVAASRGGPRP